MSSTLNPTDNPELYEAASFGKYADDFWNSDMGQYLLAHTLREYNSALEEFKTCNPADTRAVATIQARMWRAESFKEWLSLAIAEGAKALRIIEGNDNEDA